MDDETIGGEDALREVGGHRLIRLLGQGGFARVYLAESPDGEIVALKVIRSDIAKDPNHVKRFFREARLASMLRHPNIVSVYKGASDKGVYYLLMEYIEGTTLREQMRAGGISQIQALKIIKEAAKGLAYAHDRGIIHRDINPMNIMLSDGLRRVALADFGMAKPETADWSVTGERECFGTIHYMSPQQLDPSMGEVDRRTDIYALGVVLYELLVGRVPFVGETQVQIISGILAQEVPSPREANPDMGERTEELIFRVLKKDLKERPQTSEELIEGIDACLGDVRRDAAKKRAHGDRLADRGCHETALDAYRAALAMDSDLGPAWAGRGVSLVALGREEDALMAFDRAIVLDSRNGDAWLYRGIAYAHLHRMVEAVSSLSIGVEIRPTASLTMLSQDCLADLVISSHEPRLRAAAVRALDDQSSLEFALKNDLDETVRKEAAHRVKNEEILRAASKDDEDQSVRAVAAEHLAELGRVEG